MKPEKLHISLDVWNTLISPNPGYTEDRSNYLSSYFKIDNATARERYQVAKQTIDGLEKSFSPMESVSMLYRMITGKEVASILECVKIVSNFNRMFAENPPLWDSALAALLHEMRKRGVKFSILSNTNFIDGTVIRETVFDEWWAYGLFDFMFFSGENTSRKPDARFFDMLKDSASKDRTIIHIGDDLECDILGASRCGIATVMVTNRRATFDVLQQINAQLEGP